MEPADLVTECDEDFFGRAVFIRDCNENAFSVFRRDRGQREHVTLDDILLDLGDLEIAVGILRGDLRVMETMEFLELHLVPVIEKIVVKKSAPYELLLLETEREDHRQEKSGLGHSDTVVVAGAFAVLLKLFQLIEKTGV